MTCVPKWSDRPQTAYRHNTCRGRVEFFAWHSCEWSPSGIYRTMEQFRKARKGDAVEVSYDETWCMEVDQ